MTHQAKFYHIAKVDVLAQENEELIKQFMTEKYDAHREEAVTQGYQCLNTTFTILVQSTWVKPA